MYAILNVINQLVKYGDILLKLCLPYSLVVAYKKKVDSIYMQY